MGLHIEFGTKQTAGEATQHSPRADAIANLSGGHVQVEWAALDIADDVRGLAEARLVCRVGAAISGRPPQPQQSLTNDQALAVGELKSHPAAERSTAPTA